MPLDTIGLYNKLELARERAQATRGRTVELFSKEGVAAVITEAEILSGVKAIYLLLPKEELLFTVWKDPLDVELIRGQKPPAGAAAFALHDSTLEKLRTSNIFLNISKLQYARGFPKWQFFVFSAVSGNSIIADKARELIMINQKRKAG